MIFLEPGLSNKDCLDNTYQKFKDIIQAQPKYLKSNIFKKILKQVNFRNVFGLEKEKQISNKNVNLSTVIFAGGAIATSLVIYTAWQGLNRIKNSIKKTN